MKNKQALIYLFLANAISHMATGISMIAIPWYFIHHFQLPSEFKWVYFITTFVSLFWTPFSGSLIDRFSRKNIMLVISVFGSITLFSVAGYGYSTGAIPPIFAGLIFGITFLIYNIHFPNLYAFAQEITLPEHYGKITSYLEILGQASSAVAGMLAALLIEGTTDGSLLIFGITFDLGINIDAWTLKDIFLIDGATYFVSFFLIKQIAYNPVAIRGQEHSSLVNRIITGFKYLKQNPLLLIFGIASFSPFVALLLINFFLMPEYIQNHLLEGGDVYGSYEGCFALGSLFAGIFISRIVEHISRIKTIIFLSFLCAGCFFVLFYNTDLWLFFGLAVIIGMCNAAIRILRITYFFNHIPNQIIGRSNSVFFTSNIIFRLLFTAGFSASIFSQSNNIIYAFLILGLFVLISAFTLLVNSAKLEATKAFK